MTLRGEALGRNVEFSMEGPYSAAQASALLKLQIRFIYEQENHKIRNEIQFKHKSILLCFV